MNDRALLEVGPPDFYVTTMDERNLENLRFRLVLNNKDAVIRRVRGAKSKTDSAFFDEVAAAFQFPYYFGENWPAFSECVSDLEWLPETLT